MPITNAIDECTSPSMQYSSPGQNYAGQCHLACGAVSDTLAAQPASHLQSLLAMIWALSIASGEALVQVLTVMNVLLHAGLWLGGLGSLLHGNEYMHILSVIAESPYEPPESTKSHLTIPVFDVESAVLIRHFPAGIAFIKKGLEEGGKVLVHCAAGVSRSATVSLSLPQHALP
ncbi:MAG: tyrosine protein phosphatase yvh1 [Icmadophila ericetorum]|nr:tyrosine protein phosphatase yvh1 [Icmadophila ericetorum]